MATEPLVRPTECCADWAENSPKVNAPIVTMTLRGGYHYDGKPFVFCPWCGNRLPNDSKPPHTGD